MATESFRVASFNVENLLHPGVYWAGRDDPAYKPDEYQDKLEWSAGLLKYAQVDLVGFQELFSEQSIGDLLNRTELNHRYTPDLENGRNIVVGANGRKEAKGPFCGLASRYPIEEASAILDFPPGSHLSVQVSDAAPVERIPIAQFQRPVLRANVKLPHATALVFVAHLKSKRPLLLSGESDKDPLAIAAGSARSLIVRAAEAVALRKLVIEATQGSKTPVLLFGDLNDDLNAVTTQIIAGDEPYFRLKAAEKRPDWDRLLYSVHDLEMAESYRDVSYSHIYNGRYELLDHIFVSEEFYAGNPQRIATVLNTRIFNDHISDERRRAFDAGRGAARRSDHGVPVTEIVWKI